jgi:hypothetical protein
VTIKTNMTLRCTGYNDVVDADATVWFEGDAVWEAGMETIFMWYIDGVQQPGGIWGTAGSGAKHIDDTHFSGSGLVTVRYPLPPMILIIR